MFGRVWELRVDDQVYEGFDMVATSRWPLKGSATVDLTVYHPPPDLVNLSRDKASVWSIRAGYQDQGAPVEIGSGCVIPQSAKYRRTGVDPTLELQTSNRKAASRVLLQKSFSATSANEVLNYIAGECGLTASLQIPDKPLYGRGYTLGGTPVQYLNSIAKDLKCQWSIDGQTLNFWPLDSQRQNTADVWSPETGLIGEPEIDASNNTVLASAFLRPGMRNGDRILVDSDTYDGLLTVIECSHEIDTSSADRWMTSIRGRP